jgi:hypothetical protein
MITRKTQVRSFPSDMGTKVLTCPKQLIQNTNFRFLRYRNFSLARSWDLGPMERPHPKAGQIFADDLAPLKRYLPAIEKRGEVPQ